QVMAKELIEFLDVGSDRGHRLERLAAGVALPGGKPEQRQHAVADELVRLPAILDHCPRYGAQEAVDDEHGIEWQPLFRKLRRAAHVHEQADEIALLPDPDRVRG